MHPEKIPTHPLESSDPRGQWRWRCKWTILLELERKAQSEPCLRENTESLKAGWCEQNGGEENEPTDCNGPGQLL